eukprot:TRINITY_DN1111_c1_g3_i2.p1 TRINITY_DN1111_c1_g3~~TRINITY_DN1111_c1_g3_i2.p1  ORF type:complete len:453 (+),score=77.73 TRINITY_DN1111_c1_g3_i2:1022-2380(+)
MRRIICCMLQLPLLASPGSPSCLAQYSRCCFYRCCCCRHRCCRHCRRCCWPRAHHQLSITIPSAAPCTVSRFSFGTCDNARKSIVAAASPRDSCAHALAPSDVVFGVWHSLATEARLVPMLQTWAQSAQIVLLASRAGTSGTRLFHGSDAPGSNPLLLDTGVLEDDYFSTLGKAFIGLAMMHARFPRAKWFVVLGDDNYVLLANYVAALSAFDPQQPWALTRMVYRNAFQCKVAGGAGIATSAALTRALAPQLEPFYQGIYQKSSGDVKKAAQEDKFHDIAFQRMVEGLGYSFTHVNEFLHEPPGYYFNPRTGQAHGVALPARPAVLHYVPGSYMQHLHALTAEICTCDSSAHMDLLKSVAVGVYSDYRRLTAEDRQRVNNTWGKAFDVELVECESEQDSDAQQHGAASLSVSLSVYLLLECLLSCSPRERRRPTLSESVLLEAAARYEVRM